MLIRGLKSPVRNLSWLLGGLFFVLAASYPPLPTAVMYNGYRFGWAYEFLQLGASGGIVWQILSYMQWQTFAHSAWTGRLLFSTFAPYCFVPVTLPICAIIMWRKLVYGDKRPTIVRGLLAILCALALSLFLIFLLDWVGGRALLYALSISARGSLAVRGLISQVWSISIVQSAWLCAPCLAIGAMLALWQERLWVKYMSRE